MMELSPQHIELLFFVKDEVVQKGTCSFASVAMRFGNEMVLEMMTNFSLITYDGKKPLGLKWSDVAEEAFGKSIKTPVWYVPAGNIRGNRANPIMDMNSAPLNLFDIAPKCDPRLQDTEEIPESILTDDKLPTDEDIDNIQVGQGVKLSSNNKFFWATMVEIKETVQGMGVLAYRAKVVDDTMEEFGIKKDEVLEFCEAHICDII